jgi:phosphate transport system protein
MLHTFEDKKHSIKDEISDIGNKVLNSNNMILKGIKINDINIVESSKDNLRNISNIVNEIDNNIVKILALYQPEARDLREVVAYLKITNEINRAAANTKNFIKAYINQYNNVEINTKDINNYTIPLLKSTIAAFQSAIDMIYEKDIDEIHRLYNIVIVEESKTDDMYSIVEKDILKFISKKYELSQDYLSLLGGLRKLEKLADRADSIANLLLFSKDGGRIKTA